ncbi:MAG: ABC transporter ATP-binding protein, partial [Candidatus Eisenbacteria bacterium]|nr:ABC transporter ATP-binding protein [Candidatus Eisenbacteria bacterium]
MADTVIRFENVSKRFRLYHQKHYSLKENVLTRFRDRGRWEEFWALKAIDLEVPRGQMLGLIGENGSGKSTCLKLLARILVPDTGSVNVQGSLSALIELGAGFQPDFTGRENIYLNGSILGFTRREIDERLDDIVHFAELERFIDTPVKAYSSGMYMRLGFSIATHVDPDILLIDEILAVGDEAFQVKCLERIHDYRKAGKTIIFVSHALGTVEALCDRAILLSKGRVVADGDPRETVACYRRVLGIAAHTQIPVPAAPAAPAVLPADVSERIDARLATLVERLDWLERRISGPISVENAGQRILQLEDSMSIVHRQGEVKDQALRDLASVQQELSGRLDEWSRRVAAMPAVEASFSTSEHAAALAGRLAWLERRLNGPVSIENAFERLVQLEKSMGMVHQQDTTRDRALGDIASRIDQLEARLATFFAEGIAVVPRQYGTREIEFLDATFLNEAGDRTTRFTSGEPMIVRVRYRVNGPVANPVIGFSLLDQRGAVA